MLSKERLQEIENKAVAAIDDAGQVEDAEKAQFVCTVGVYDLTNEIHRLRKALYDVSRSNEGAMASHGMDASEALAKVVEHAKEALGAEGVKEQARLDRLTKQGPWGGDDTLQSLEHEGGK